MRFTRTRVAWLLVGGPPLVFCAGVASVLFLGVPLWPYQLFYRAPTRVLPRSRGR